MKDKKNLIIVGVVVLFLIIVPAFFLILSGGSSREYNPETVKPTGAVAGIMTDDAAFALKVNEVVFDYDPDDEEVEISDDEQLIRMNLAAKRAGDNDPYLNYTGLYLDNSDTEENEDIKTTVLADSEFELDGLDADGHVIFLASKDFNKDNTVLGVLDEDLSGESSTLATISMSSDSDAHEENTQIDVTDKSATIEGLTGTYTINVNGYTRNYKPAEQAEDSYELEGTEIVQVQVEITTEDDSVFVTKSDFQFKSDLMKLPEFILSESLYTEGENHIQFDNISAGTPASGNLYLETFKGDSNLVLLIDGEKEIAL